MTITRRSQANIAWLLTGAVIVLVIANVYSNISHKQHVANHPHPHLITDHNNNNESECLCPFTSTQSP